jgi:hypothetical protein
MIFFISNKILLKKHKVPLSTQEQPKQPTTRKNHQNDNKVETQEGKKIQILSFNS